MRDVSICVLLLMLSAFAVTRGSPSARYAACLGLTAEATRICDDVLGERLAILAMLEAGTAASAPMGGEYTEVRTRLDAAIRETPELSLKMSGRLPSQLCRIRWSTQVQCIELVQLVARYDSDVGESIIDDVRSLYRLADIEGEGGTLIGCGPGAWASSEHVTSEDGWIDSTSVARVLSRCASAGRSVLDTASFGRTIDCPPGGWTAAPAFCAGPRTCEDGGTGRPFADCATMDAIR